MQLTSPAKLVGWIAAILLFPLKTALSHSLLFIHILKQEERHIDVKGGLVIVALAFVNVVERNYTFLSPK